jgi:heme-degrading monooxygenase HmoA
MFARVSRSRYQQDKLDEQAKIMQESVVPAAKSQKGFRGIYALFDRKTGKSISISLWETEEDAVANEKSGYFQEQVDKVASYRVEEPVIERYEVVAQG